MLAAEFQRHPHLTEALRKVLHTEFGKTHDPALIERHLASKALQDDIAVFLDRQRQRLQDQRIRAAARARLFAGCPELVSP